MIHKNGNDWHLDLSMRKVLRRWGASFAYSDSSAPLRLEAAMHQFLIIFRRFEPGISAQAAELFRQDRAPFLSQRTIQFKKERLRPLVELFGDSPLRKIRGEDIRAFQKLRIEAGERVAATRW